MVKENDPVIQITLTLPEKEGSKYPTCHMSLSNDMVDSTLPGEPRVWDIDYECEDGNFEDEPSSSYTPLMMEKLGELEKVLGEIVQEMRANMMRPWSK